MVSLTSSFNHYMSPQSLLDFFFPHTSSHAFRTPSLKDFHKSGALVLTSCFTLFSNLTLVRFSFNFQMFLVMIRCFFTTFFRTLLSRSTITSLSEVTMESLSHLLYTFCIFLPQAQINFCLTSTGTISNFRFVCLIKPSVCHAQLSFITELQQYSSFSISFPNTLPPCAGAQPGWPLCHHSPLVLGKIMPKTNNCLKICW